MILKVKKIYNKNLVPILTCICVKLVHLSNLENQKIKVLKSLQTAMSIIKICKKEMKRVMKMVHLDICVIKVHHHQ